METAIVYHRYNLNHKIKKVWQDKQFPILASIASLRAVNKTVKIYVLDTEPLLEDWGSFPGRLNFHVVQQPPQIPVQYEGGHQWQGRMSSRIWDIWNFAREIPEEIVMYTDSDILWRKDPLPLSQPLIQGIYGDSRVDALFYFKTRCLETEVFVHTWMALALAGAQSSYLRTKMRISGYYMPLYCCEVPYVYMIRHGMTYGWHPVSKTDSYSLDSRDEKVDQNAKNYHLLSRDFGFDKLRVARRVKDFHNGIRSVLPQREADLLLGDQPPDVEFSDIASLFV